MGFPTWTLIGMGVTAVLALLMTVLAYLAQSPRALVRLGLVGQRLDLRVKLFTGYALASLILMLGFFLAGVPLDTSAMATAASTPATETASIQLPSDDTGAMGELPPTAVVSDSSQNTETETIDENTAQTPSSGAFGGPPPSSSDEVATEEIPPSATPEQVGPSATPDGDEVETAVPTTQSNGEASTATALPSPTTTNTPLPTATPTPTITPTPIQGITGTINTDGSTLWVRRSPGGQNLVIVQDNEIVLMENGRANQGGILWREIRTVSGIVGWIQAEFLDEE
jgi:cytoskeletal protein RodZ